MRVDQLKEEIGRCELLKMDNIGRVIVAVRQQLKDWHERCCISDEECHAFQPADEGLSLVSAQVVIFHCHIAAPKKTCRRLRKLPDVVLTAT